ncbi:MAG: septum site-determining protein MinC [Chloroflexi bacterium]|nr:septum site-determining protein MinC [Chloroflexota bacterium]
MNEIDSLIQIKGLRDSLLVSVAEASWEEQRAALLSQIDARQAFFHGARLALDVGTQIVKVNELVELRDRLSERNVSLWAVISESPTTENTAQLLGLATRISKPQPEDTRQFAVQDLGEGTALFVNRTLRSGTRIEFESHVVVLGDVNPGAEIVAEGNVIVWGRLRGAVHAGSKGNESAVVCALDFMPMRLQIAEDAMNVAGRKETGRPEMAFIQDQKVIIEPWQPGSTG